MGDNGIRRIPVVDEDGKLQGIVTLDDAVVLLGTELGNVAETIQAQIDRL
jgi:CBS domain-containing protein